ncbi:hypothetical protein [Motilibacter deserti]|uniref:Integral membrane protein n=1 Tax=Motilibacter deserti TaxID=2714956 RepID=A0ABX0GUT6_9ACTN|nr:hypothetical protein [Motilibacter deserti]NHC14320.1 hypothetical protein [Motilibacter deserti]
MTDYPSAPPPGGFNQYGVPNAPAAPPEQQQRGPRPKSVDLAVKLMYVGAALSALSILASLLGIDAIREQLEDQGDLTASEIDTAVAVGVTVGIIGAVVGAALWILNAVFCGRGANWSRIFGTVLGGLAVLFWLVGLTQEQTALSLVLGAVQVVVAAAVIFLLWKPESNRFFKPAPSYR